MQTMKIIFPIISMIIFLSILVGSIIYMSKRFGFYFGIESLRPLYLLFTATTLFMIGGLAGFTNSVSVIGSVLYKLAATIMGLVLYLLLSALIVQLASLFFSLKPNLHGLIVVGITLFISGYGIINAYSTRVKEVRIPVSGLDKEYSIMHLTDIHVGHFRGAKFLGRLVKKTNRKEADLVVITGDLFDGRVRLFQEVLEPFEEFKAPAYFVEGNHDGYTGMKEVKQLVRNAGITVLENQQVDLKTIRLIGLNHMAPDSNTVGMHMPSMKHTIRSVLEGMEIGNSKPSVLLHHSPDGIEFASRAGIDVYLSGHTHAGQLFPVTFINDLIFRYNRGISEFNGTRIFVSPGAGTFGPPMRIGTRSEINLIKLVPEK